jgi:hypothetical protein
VKFLVMWRIELGLLSKQMATAVARMPEIRRAAGARRQGDRPLPRGRRARRGVDLRRRLQRGTRTLLGLAPVYNFARYTVYPLADMDAAARQLPE